MDTNRLAKIAMTVAAVSLVANVIQLSQARSQARAQQWEIARLHVEHRKNSMFERAAAFHEFVLGGRHKMVSSERSGMDSGAYKVEYAVQVPQDKQPEFEQWMAGAKLSPIVFPPSRGQGSESGMRLVTKSGRESVEMFENFEMTRY